MTPVNAKPRTKWADQIPDRRAPLGTRSSRKAYQSHRRLPLDRSRCAIHRAQTASPDARRRRHGKTLAYIWVRSVYRPQTRRQARKAEIRGLSKPIVDLLNHLVSLNGQRFGAGTALSGPRVLNGLVFRSRPMVTMSMERMSMSPSRSTEGSFGSFPSGFSLRCPGRDAVSIGAADRVHGGADRDALARRDDAAVHALLRRARRRQRRAVP